MDPLTERELTRLSFLVSSLVARPALAERFAKQVQRQPGPHAFAEVVRQLVEYIDEFSGGQVTDRDTLRDVAARLIRSDKTEHQRVGRLLAGALETASTDHQAPRIGLEPVGQR